MFSRRISLMRACQPAPSCRKASSTSGSSRSVWLTFLSALRGLPRLRRRSSCVAFSPINRGRVSAAGCALAKSSFVHLGLSSSGRATRSSFVFFAIQPYLSSACSAEADDPQILTARCHDHRVEAAIKARNHTQARLAIVAAGVFHNNRGVPIEFDDPLERQPALSNVPSVLLRIETDRHMKKCYSRKL